MSLHFTTESDSHYEIRRTPWDYSEIRRMNADATKRADGEWVRLIGHTAIVEGASVALYIASLAEYGADDVGTPREEAESFTTRMTTPVVKIWTVPEC